MGGTGINLVGLSGRCDYKEGMKIVLHYNVATQMGSDTVFL